VIRALAAGHHGEGDGRGQGRVHGVAAGGQHAQARLDRQGLAGGASAIF
jgi:hypothetical protein